MERCVLAAARDGLPAVIVNPTSFIGPWEFRKFDDCFVNLVLSGRFPIVMSQMNSVIDVRDVAAAIDRAVSRELFGCPIALAGHNVSLPDLVYRTAQVAGMRFPPPVPFDSETSTMIAFWGQTACNLLGIESPNPWKLIPLVADLVPMSPSPAQIALGVKIRPLEETLRDSVAFHRRRGRG
jgi:dihydroflavonol-4-reductase